MDIQVLVSTMNQEGYELIEKMNINSDAIIVNQCDVKSSEYINKNNFKIKWINSDKKGLSRSRNLAIQNATSDICILADDDIEYIPDYNNIIIEQFKLDSEADIIAFQVEGIDEEFKKYHERPRKVNFLTSMRISSVEIAFKRDTISGKGIRFNEAFGAGSKYFAGEENIFLMDCLRKGIIIKYVPIKIADLHIGESSWFKGYNKEYFIVKGANFTAMSKLFSIPFILQFALRKYNLYKENLTLLESIKTMLRGRKNYLDENRKSEL